MNKKKVFLLLAIFVIALGGFTHMNLDTNVAKNTSLLTLDRIETLGIVEFYIKPNGNVGIFNSNPSVALEIGSTSTSYVFKLNA
jgi:hypothetical protein